MAQKEGIADLFPPGYNQCDTYTPSTAPSRQKKEKSLEHLKLLLQVVVEHIVASCLSLILKWKKIKSGTSSCRPGSS
jgi:hypothetical protein